MNQKDLQLDNLNVSSNVVVNDRLTTPRLRVSDTLKIGTISGIQTLNVLDAKADNLIVNGNISATNLQTQTLTQTTAASTATTIVGGSLTTTATGGEVSLAAPGAKLSIQALPASNASVGVSGPMAVSELLVNTTACKTTSLIFITRSTAAPSDPMTFPSIQIIADGTFRIFDPQGSSMEDFSFWNWLIIN